MDERRVALRRWHATGVAVVRVIVAEAKGSTPREAGATLFVTSHELLGTIGGGDLEWQAVHAARALLARDGLDDSVELSISLGPGTGQCCGGYVRLRLDRLDENGLLRQDEQIEQEQHARPLLLLFGAGHVGRALAHALAPLPLRLIWVDSRPEEFGAVPEGVQTVADGGWERVLDDAPPGTGALVLTHNHSLDALIVAAALERGDLAYIGMIGSMTKRRRFERGFRDQGLSETQIQSLVCPIGDRGIRDKRPEVIAALVTAEIVERLLHHPSSDFSS